MKKTKIISKVIVFVLLFLIIFYKISSIFAIGQKDSPTIGTYSSFFKEPENTLQVVTLGNSRMLLGWNALSLWENTGIPSYDLSTFSQPGVFIKYLMEEVRKTQENPLFIVDVNCFRADQVNFLNEANIRRVTDCLPLSKNKSDMIEAALEYYPEAMDYQIAKNADDKGLVQELKQEKENVSKLSYYWSFLKYHSRWTELNKFDFIGKRNTFKSVIKYDPVFDVTPLDDPELTTKTASLNEVQTALLNDLLSYVKENKINVLFVSMPANLHIEYVMQVNQIMTVLESEGYTCLDFNKEDMYQELGLSFKTDFSDVDHLNVEGSKKFMDFMATYLTNNYSVTDQRGVAGYESWDEAVIAYDEYVEKIQQEN